MSALELGDPQLSRPERTHNSPLSRFARSSRSNLVVVVDSDRVRQTFTWLGSILLFYFVQQYLWPAPLGVMVQGMVIGGLTALISIGMALVYRANRIINFAQAELGAVPAALGVLLIVALRWPYPVALITAIGAAVVLGVLVEYLFIRRFFRAPRLILTVVTIGIGGLLAAGGVVLPRAFDLRIPPQDYPSPFDFSFTITKVVFQGNDVMAMVAVPAAIAGLVVFFRYTNVGIAVRASSESADRAFLLGVPVRRINTIVWVVASVLAALSMILRAGVIGLPIGRVLGPAILLRALAAAVIGRMENYAVIFAAALGLGIVERAVFWNTANAQLADPVLFVVVLGALLLQRRTRISRIEDAQTSTWRAAREVRPIPRELIGLPEIRWGLRGLRGAFALFLVLVPVLLSESRVSLASAVIIYAIVGISLVILTGWAGQISLGQIGLFGMGAAVAGWVTSRQGWDPIVALVLAGLAGAILAMVVGLPALRIRGLFLAATTFAFALATSSYLLNRSFFGWLPTERILRKPVLGRIDVTTEARFYYFTLAAFAVAVFAVRGIRNSRTGRILIGVRENERAAQAYGVNAVRAKLTAFAMSGFLAAYAGGLFVHHQEALGVQPYLPEQSLQVFVMVVIGGLGSVPGALLGALYLKGISWFFPQWSLFTSAFGVLLILLVIPEGLASVFYTVRDTILRRVADRRGIVVPSLVADVRERDELELAPFDLGADQATAPLPTIDGDGGTGPGRARRAVRSARRRTS